MEYEIIDEIPRQIPKGEQKIDKIIQEMQETNKTRLLNKRKLQ